MPAWGDVHAADDTRRCSDGCRTDEDGRNPSEFGRQQPDRGVHRDHTGMGPWTATKGPIVVILPVWRCHPISAE